MKHYLDQYYKKDYHERCESCVYFVVENSYMNNNNEWEDFGWCKRYPPSNADGERPYVGENDFCGEHKFRGHLSDPN